jgi:ABC-type dipeptide/oligopeptide/nickel transport system permease subunit
MVRAIGIVFIPQIARVVRSAVIFHCVNFVGDGLRDALDPRRR